MRFALVDCNNFFVSCERVFNPKLIGKPVVVLSSNDACVIARSNEAKALGIAMGAPAFECEQIFKKHNVIVYSSNFALYGDMSARVMQVLSQYATDIEIYSVDEAFLFLPKQQNYTQYIQYIRKQVKQKTGIPVSIGIGLTKTLAKVANKFAKKSADGVFDLTAFENNDQFLEQIEIQDVWGIGYRYAKLLKSKKIFNAKNFKYMDERWVRKNMTINGLRTLQELNGISCISLNNAPATKKSITVSRSFGKNVTNINELKEAVSTYANIACEKLRAQKSIASNISIFVCFRNYQDNDRYYKFLNYTLPIASNYTPDFIKAATGCVEKIFRQGIIYKKAGIIINDLIPHDFIQMHTSHALADIEKQNKISNIFDKINKKWGRDSVSYASAGIDKLWKVKRLKKSDCYTTSWSEILTIRI